MKYIGLLLLIGFLTTPRLSGAADQRWDCDLLINAIKSDAVYFYLLNWVEENKKPELKEGDHRLSSPPGFYALVDEREFDWGIFPFTPFSPEIQILGRDRENPEGYFFRIHRMFGFAVIIRDEPKVGIDRKSICYERGPVLAYNMPESTMGGPPRLSQNELTAWLASEVLRNYLVEESLKKGASSLYEEALQHLGTAVKWISDASGNQNVYSCGEWSIVVQDDQAECFLDLPGSRLYRVKTILPEFHPRVVDFGVERRGED